MSGELVFAGTWVEVKTFVDHLKAGDTVEGFLNDFPTVSREQAEGYLQQSAKSNSYEDLMSLINEMNSALTSAGPGTVRSVPAEPP